MWYSIQITVFMILLQCLIPWKAGFYSSRKRNNISCSDVWISLHLSFVFFFSNMIWKVGKISGTLVGLQCVKFIKHATQHAWQRTHLPVYKHHDIPAFREWYFEDKQGISKFKADSSMRSYLPASNQLCCKHTSKKLRSASNWAGLLCLISHFQGFTV